MALTSFCGSFNITTGAINNTISVTGAGFLPKAIFFWTVDTSTPNAVNAGDTYESMGFSTGSTANRAMGTRMVDASANMVVKETLRNDCCILLVNTTSGTTGRAVINSFDSDGFTVKITEVFAQNLRVHFMCWGGSDLTNVKTGAFTFPASTGNLATTGVGFQPDAVLFIHCNGSSENTWGGNSQLSFGVAVNASQQWITTVCSTDAGASSTESHYAREGECIALGRTDGAGMQNRGSLVSMDADGWTINCHETGLTNRQTYYLAFKGGQWGAGAINFSTGTTEQTESGLTHQPQGLLFASACKQENLQDAIGGDRVRAFGAVDGALHRTCATSYAPNAQATSAYWQVSRNDAVIANATDASTIEALLDVNGYTAAGFVWQMDDAASSALPVVLYLSCGNTAGAGTGAKAYAAIIG